MRITAYDLEIAIDRRFCGSNDLKFSNVFMWGMFESDYVRVTKAGYVHEYEIKTSKTDFRKDFDKQYTTSDRNNNYARIVKNKHEMIAKGESGLKSFSFVTPENLISVKDIPHHAGLYYVKDFRIKCIKTPPNLKAVKLGDKKLIDLLMKTYNRYADVKQERLDIRIDKWLAEKILAK